MTRRVLFSASRTGVIVHLTLLEAIRQRFFNALLVLAAGMIVGAQLLREFNFGASELKFLSDLGFGAITLFGTALSIVLAAQLFFAEIENRTAMTLLAKPVWRGEFVLGKFFGIALVLLLFTVTTTAVLMAVLFMRERALMAAVPDAFAGGHLVQFGGIAVFALIQWMKFCVIISITLLVAGFAQTNLYAVALSFLIVLICHLQYLAQESWQRMATVSGRVGGFLLAMVFPNFQMFAVGDRIAAGHAVPAAVAASSLGYGLIYVIVLLGLAVFIFRRREI